MSRYSKAIASALGGVIATVAGVFLGWDPVQINTQAVAISGALGTLIPMAFVFFAPRNAE